MNTKRTLIRTVGILVLALASSIPALADEYPTRPIRLIVPFAPGGNTDVAGRLISTGLGALLGQAIVVDNKGGAGGSIGAGMAAKSAPDGYTLLLTSSALTINPAIYEKVPYDMVKDFEPVGLSMTTSLVLIASPSLGVKTMAELLAVARAKPGKLTFGSAGVGSGSHLAGELFNQIARVRTMHVPYKGSGPATAAVLSGEVDYSFTSLSAAAPLYKGGRVVALAITAPSPSPLFPSVPTADSAGLKGFDAGDWIGIAAPAGTPKAVIDRLNSALTKWLSQPATKEQLAQAGFEAKSSTPQEFKRLIESELVKWSRTAKLAGIKAE